MAGMSRNNSTSSFQGFSVFQPALGSTLQWLPALGSYELEEMIHTFLPGPASIQDKRAHISMDFYEFSRQTGETFKFYPIHTASFASTTTDSPASSSAMHDSGYGSSFNVSPVVSDMSPWTPSISASTPPSSTSESRSKSRPSPSQRTTSTTTRHQLDFSNHPGMRILTKDGRDITNSASRGCKSKEQRDHAHLMRIIKACDACRRKKIRCDPSHKRRTSSQAQPSRPDTKPAKKAKISVHDFSRQDFNSFATPSSLDPMETFETDVASASPFEDLNENPEDFWQQFVHFEDQGLSFPGEHHLFLDPAGYVASSNGSSSASPSQSLLPSTPALSGNCGVLLDLVGQEPALPYLNPGDSYGTNYQDFNLYSPSPTSDVLDEEPQFVRKPRRKVHSSRQDNLLETSLQQASHEQPTMDDYAYLYGGQNHQHGDLLGTGISDWSLVLGDGSRAQNTDHSANDIHGSIPSTTDPSTNSVIAGGRLSRSRPSNSLGSALGAYRVPVNGVVQGPSLESGVQTAVPDVGIIDPISPTPLMLPDVASVFINGRLYSSRLVDTSGASPTVSQPLPVSAEASDPTALVQAGTSVHSQTAGQQSSTGQSAIVDLPIFGPALQQAASLSLRRGVFTRSAFVLEPNDYSDVVTRERVESLLSPSSAGPVPGAGKGVDGKAVGTGLPGLRQAPQVRDLPSASESMLMLSGCASVALACSVEPPLPTRQGVPSDPTEDCQPSAIKLDRLANFALIFYLAVLLVRWASLGWQLELLLALSFSVSSYRRPSHGQELDQLFPAATKPAGVLWRCFREATALRLIEH